MKICKLKSMNILIRMMTVITIFPSLTSRIVSPPHTRELKTRPRAPDKMIFVTQSENREFHKNNQTTRGRKSNSRPLVNILYLSRTLVIYYLLFKSCEDESLSPGLPIVSILFNLTSRPQSEERLELKIIKLWQLFTKRPPNTPGGML